MSTRTIHYGLGTVGLDLLRVALERRDFEVVAVIDTHPGRAGQDLGSILNVDSYRGLKIAYDPETVLRETSADIVFHTTDQALTSAFPEIMQAVSAGKNVISNCQELVFPWLRYRDIAQRLDQQARQSGVCVLGAGVGPGLVADILPLFLAMTCQQITGVQASRRINLLPHLLEVRESSGIGLSPEGFERARVAGMVGMPGSVENVALIADTLGWRLDDIKQTMAPLLAEERIKTDYLVIEKGYIAGVRQKTVGTVGGREVIRIEVEASLTVSQPQDEVMIEGKPPVHAVIPKGLSSEAGSAALMANCAPAIARGRYLGLITLRDLPIAPYRHPGVSEQQQTGTYPSLADTQTGQHI